VAESAANQPTNGFTREEVASCIHRGSKIGEIGRAGCNCTGRKGKAIINICRFYSKPCVFEPYSENRVQEKICIHCKDCAPKSTDQK
jgi:hypothetical protein